MVGLDFGARFTGLIIFSQPFANCVAFGKSFSISVPQSSQMEITI